jgi:hypothetical protein
MLKQYVVEKALAIFETFVTEHWDDIVKAGEEGMTALIAYLKARLLGDEQEVFGAAEGQPLVAEFSARLDVELPTEEAAE